MQVSIVYWCHNTLPGVFPRLCRLKCFNYRSLFTNFEYVFRYHPRRISELFLFYFLWKTEQNGRLNYQISFKSKRTLIFKSLWPEWFLIFAPIQGVFYICSHLSYSITQKLLIIRCPSLKPCIYTKRHWYIIPNLSSLDEFTER